MKILILFFASVLLLGACTNRDMYDAMQKSQQLECQKSNPLAYEECIKKNSESYEEYERKRQQVLQRSQSGSEAPSKEQ